MLKAAYNLLFQKVKEVRGYTLDDNPYTWQEIMQAFDAVQNLKSQGIEITESLLENTSLCYRIIIKEGGKDCPKYIVASNLIAQNCLQLLSEMINSICVRVTWKTLNNDAAKEMLMRVEKLQNLLNRIGEFYMIPDVVNRHKDMINKLAEVEEQLIAFVAIC